MRTKHDLDRQVAMLLGMKKKDVSAITDAFLHEAARTLVEDEEVFLNHLGTLTIQKRAGGKRLEKLRTGNFRKGFSRPITVPVPYKYYVTFAKCVPLKKAIHAKLKPQEK